MTPNATHTQFLVNVLSTAGEIGISHWAETIHIEGPDGITPEGDNLDPRGSGGNNHAATIRDYDTGDTHHIALDTIRQGLRLLNQHQAANDAGTRSDIEAETGRHRPPARTIRDRDLQLNAHHRTPQNRRAARRPGEKV